MYYRYLCHMIYLFCLVTFGFAGLLCIFYHNNIMGLKTPYVSPGFPKIDHSNYMHNS